MKKTLIVVDMQNDFIDMALGTEEAVAILPKVKAKITEYAERGDEIIIPVIPTVRIILKRPKEKNFP